MAKYGELSEADAIDKIWDGAKAIGICMFVTWDGEATRARPVAARAHREDNAFYVLTDVHGKKDDQVEQFPKVTLAFADTHANTYLSVTGRASVSDDRAKIRELWSVYDKAFWDSPDDPSLRLITVKPDDGEIWDGAGRLWGGIAMATHIVTGADLKLGDNKKVAHL